MIHLLQASQLVFHDLALASLPPNLDAICNQILSNPTVPTYDMISEQLLHLSTLHAFGHSTTLYNNSTTRLPFF
ncbi:hypothetical protein CR513_37237, partial [Mucuna pruriens]